MTEVNVNNLKISNSRPFTLIAGLNVLESDKVIEQVITHCIEVTKKLKIPYIFKASYDKANRSSVDSYRGPGVNEGLRILSNLKEEFKVPIISDVHTVEEAVKVSKSVDVLQIPAFLCRQGDLLKAAVTTGKIINVTATKTDGSKTGFKVKVRIDANIEVDYYQHGGVLQYVLRKMVKESK